MLALIGFMADVWASLQPGYVMGVIHLCDNISMLSKNKHIHQGNWLWYIGMTWKVSTYLTNQHTHTHTHTMTGQIPNTSNPGI